MRSKDTVPSAKAGSRLEKPASASTSPGTRRAELERAAEQALAAEAASAHPAAGGAVPRWLAQTVTARWPPLLGSLLKAARQRKGFSRRKAAQRLEQRLQKEIAAQASERALREWEEKNGGLPPWLLVAYLQALEAPIEDWLRVLVDFADASGDKAFRDLVVDVSLYVEKATKQQKRELFPVLRHWVELQADLVGKAWGFHLVSGALAELVPGIEPENPAQLRGGIAGLMQRFDALDKGIAGLLAQTAEPERGDGEPE